MFSNKLFVAVSLSLSLWGVLPSAALATYCTETTLCHPECYTQCKINKYGQYVCNNVCTDVCETVTECSYEEEPGDIDPGDQQYFDDVAECSELEDPGERSACYAQIQY